MANYKISKTYSNNPFVDELLYYVKQLAFGAVIKNEQEADNNETEDSLIQADMLIMSTEGNVPYEICEFSKDQMLKVGVDPELANFIITRRTNRTENRAYSYDDIPEGLKEPLRQLYMKDYINTYTELNDYYRTICGLPKIGDYGIPLRDYEYLLPDGNLWNATYVHEIGASGAKLLNSYGILEQIKTDYPQADYLNYIECGITPYSARKAYGFQLLYTPTIEEENIAEQFRYNYEQNRIYVRYAIYSEAFKYNSDFYCNFICLLILLLTMTEMLSKIQENILKYELLDRPCVEAIFEKFGMEYYKSIPLKYQKRIAKNLNKLIHNKSSAKGMFDIVNLFGVENLTIFRYFILRDRQLDRWGNFIYEEMVTKDSRWNDMLLETNVERKINDLTIPYPFENFLEKGNVMDVWFKRDNKWVKATRGVDYDVNNYDHLEIKPNGLGNGATDIRYNFYYDDRTKGGNNKVDTDNSLFMKLDVAKMSHNKFKFTPPTPNYISRGNDLIVFLAGEPLQKDAYDIDIKTNTITIKPTYGGTTDREVFVLYLYNNYSNTKFSRVDVLSEDYDRKIFKVPEPFTNYCANGNGFFLTHNGTFISPSRYTFIDTNTIQLNDTDAVQYGVNLTFNFIYAEAAVYSDIALKTHVEVLEHNEDRQIEFKLHPPIENYFRTGYKVFVKINDKWLEQDWYQAYNNTLSFNSRAIGARKTDKVEVIYRYGPAGIEATNISMSTQRLEVGAKDQTVYPNLKFPVDGFTAKNGKVIIDVYGKFLEPNQYTINEQTATLTIKDKNLITDVGTTINISYLYGIESSEAIKVTEELIEVSRDGQTDFGINVPFSPYFATLQGAMVSHRTRIVNPNNIKFTDTSVSIKGRNFKKGETFSIIYFFNNKYLLNAANRVIIENKTITTEDAVDNDLQIKIPVPFENFIQNNWKWYVSSNGVVIDPSLYEIVNGNLSFKNPNDVLKYPNLTFTFIYLDDPYYIFESSEEDVDKNFDLKFVGVPLDKEYFVDDIMAKSNIKPYDLMTLEDVFWDGVGAEDDLVTAHEKVKHQILKKKFNYARTKYFAINYLMDIADMSFQIAYFYNLLFDDYPAEEDLTVSLPNISTAKEFKIGHVFSYLTALAYLDQDTEDKIMDTPSKIMYIKGFNMHADLPALKKEILKARQTLDMYPVWDFFIPEKRLKSIEEFTTQYKTNKKVYDTITYGMGHATKYRYYKIWKDLYDSMMITEFNLTYFKKSDGHTATTFTDFLKDKDTVLYNSIKRIASITDRSTRKEKIAETVSNVAYLLENYFGGYEFHHIFDRFPGASETSLMDYAFTIINFFKSYKISMISKGDFIQFSNNDPRINFIRPVDDIEITVNLNKVEYFDIDMNVTYESAIHTSKYEKIPVYDRLTIKSTSTNTDPKFDQEFVVHIQQTQNQTIRVLHNGEYYTEDFFAKYGDEFEVEIIPDDGYKAGYPSYNKGIIVKDLTITATPAVSTNYRVVIRPPHHTTITVYEFDPENPDNVLATHTETFEVKAGTRIAVDVESDFGWTPGVANITSGIINHYTIITASEPIRQTSKFTIGHVPTHQKIELKVFDDDGIGYQVYTVNGNDSTDGKGVDNKYFNIPTFVGVKYEAKITSDWGYDPSPLKYNLPKKDMFRSDNVVFDLEDSQLTEFTFTIDKFEDQTISVVVDGVTHTETFKVPYLTEYEVNIEGKGNHVQGKLLVYDKDGIRVPSTGVVNGDMRATATASRIARDFNIKVIQSDKQQITVRYDGTDHTTSFVAKEGRQYSATIVSMDPNYDAGEIYNKEGIVRGDTVIYATPATTKVCRVNIEQDDHQTIVVTLNGKEYTESFDAHYGDLITVAVKPDNGFIAGAPSTTMERLTSPSINIEAAMPTRKKLQIHVRNPWPTRQTMNVNLNGIDYPITKADQIIQANFGDVYLITNSDTFGYYHANYTVNDDIVQTDTIGYSGTVTYNIDVTTEKPRAKLFNATITDRKYQHVKVKFYDEDTGALIKTVDGTTTVQIPYGSRYEVELSVKDNPGFEVRTGFLPEYTGRFEGNKEFKPTPAARVTTTFTVGLSRWVENAQHILYGSGGRWQGRDRYFGPLIDAWFEDELRFVSDNINPPKLAGFDLVGVNDLGAQRKVMAGEGKWDQTKSISFEVNINGKWKSIANYISKDNLFNEFQDTFIALWGTQIPREFGPDSGAMVIDADLRIIEKDLEANVPAATNHKKYQLRFLASDNDY